MKATIIGQGTYGIVTSEEGKAIKSFRGDREAFLREVLHGCSLDHDNIVWFEHIDMENLRITMPMYDCDLGTWLEEDHSLNDRLQVFRQILHGVHYLHHRGIIHGDLTHRNIFLDDDGSNVVLGDLNTCMFNNTASCKYALTVCEYASFESGTPDDDDKCYTYATDIWSLGCLLYYILYGEFLFSGKHCVADEYMEKITLTYDGECTIVEHVASIIRESSHGDIYGEYAVLIAKCLLYYDDRITIDGIYEHLGWEVPERPQPICDDDLIARFSRIRKGLPLKANMDQVNLHAYLRDRFVEFTHEPKFDDVVRTIHEALLNQADVDVLDDLWTDVSHFCECVKFRIY